MEYENYGYCRISTHKQNIERQERNIQDKYPGSHIVKETYNGTKIEGRKDWNRLYAFVIKEAGTKKIRIIFDSVSRFCRNADEGCELYEEMFKKGIELVFLKEPHINTEVYRQALDNQLKIEMNTGNKATDDLMTTIIEALNKYIGIN